MGVCRKNPMKVSFSAYIHKKCGSSIVLTKSENIGGFALRSRHARFLSQKDDLEVMDYGPN